MAGTSTPLKTPNSRVFLIEGRARGDHKPSYESGLRMMGVSQGFGDIERVEVPDPYEYGKYVEVAQIRGAEERATTSLEGRFAMSLKSTLLELARRKCAADVQLHIGKCTDPSLFNTFEKIIVLEQAYLTNYGTDDLGNLASADEAVVNENADISAKELYEILPLSFGTKAGSIVTNELVDATLCDYASCGDCEDESSGCEKVYAISKAAGGSPSTPADIVFTVDGGVVWYAHDIDSLGAAEDPNGIDCLGAYIIVVSNASNSLHYALKSIVDGLTDPTWTEVTTGFVTGGEPNAIFSVGGKAFIVGDSGYVYVTEDPTAGVTVLDAGTATVDNLLDVEALSETFIVAVGNNGAIILSEDGVNFAAVTSPVGVAINLNFICLKNESEWWVGTSTGRLYYTIDGGDTWTEKAFPGSGSGVCYDMQFASDTVAILSHATSTPSGRLLRSYDGGYSWQVLPERAGATLPANDRVNKVVVCSEDVNWVTGVGLNDNGSDGIILMGGTS